MKLILFQNKLFSVAKNIFNYCRSNLKPTIAKKIGAFKLDFAFSFVLIIVLIYYITLILFIVNFLVYNQFIFL